MNLRPYQERAVASVLEALKRPIVVTEEGTTGRGCVLIAATGAGKCLGRGTPVMRVDGSVVPVESVQVGDSLMGPDGRARLVISTNTGIGPLFKVIPIKGESWVCNDVHVMTLVHTVTGDVVDIQLDDWHRQTDYFRHCHKLFRVPVESFARPSGELPLSPYFLGIIIGDGGLRQGSLVVSKPDIEIREECEAQAKSFGLRLVSADSPDNCPSWRFSGRSKIANPIVELLRGLGLWGLHSEDRFVPDAYRFGTSDQRREMLAGLLDSDGHHTHGGYDWISKSSRLAADVCFIARSLGLAAYVQQCTKRCQTGAAGTYYRVSISGDCSDLPLRIERKKALSREQKKDVLRTGFSVEALGDGEFFGFTLEGDGRFLLGDFTVTHNTIMMAHIGARFGAAAARPVNVLVIQHRRELLAQNRQKFQRVNRDWCTSVFMGTQKVFARSLGYAGAATFASSQSLSRPDALARMPAFDLVLIDECHHSVSPEQKAILARCIDVNPDVRFVGVTATPERADRKSLCVHFDLEADRITIAELVQEGFLVTPRGHLVQEAISERLSEHLRNEESRKRIIAKVREVAGSRQTVAFCETVADARMMSEAFTAEGIPATVVTGEDDDTDRDSRLAAYARRDFQAVFNVGVLTEGWDDQQTSFVLLLRKVGSKSLLIQIIGRGLRIVDIGEYPDAAPKDDCLIMDFGGSIQSLGGLDQVLNLNAPRRKRQPGPPPMKPCPECRKIISIAATECIFCGFVYPKEVEEQAPLDLLEEIVLRPLDLLLKQTDFAWIDLPDRDGRARGRTKIATAGRAWALVTTPRMSGVWYALGATEAEPYKPQFLAQGTLTEAMNHADTFLSRNGDSRRYGRGTHFMRIAPSPEQLAFAAKRGVHVPDRATMYEVSCWLSAAANRTTIRALVADASAALAEAA